MPDSAKNTSASVRLLTPEELRQKAFRKIRLAEMLNAIAEEITADARNLTEAAAAMERDL